MEKRVSPPTRRRKAVTSDVVGADFASNVPRKWRRYYERLIQMRTFLRQGKRNQLGAANQQNLKYSQHMADVATNSYEKDLALSRVSSEQDALFEIGAALDRIEESTYGICELTGKPIERERLEAIPWTRFSADAERKLEAEGQIKKPRIPAASTIARSSSGNTVGETWNHEHSEPPRKAGKSQPKE